MSSVSEIEEKQAGCPSSNSLTKEPTSKKSKPKLALLQQAERILAASETDTGAILEAIGGPIADILGRDGDVVQKVEAITALKQVGVLDHIYPALEDAVLGAPDQRSISTPSKGKKNSKKKRESEPEDSTVEKKESVVFTKSQFQQLIRTGLQQSLEHLKEEAADESRPATIISIRNVKELRQLQSPWEQINKLAILLGETDHRADVRSGIIVDYYCHHFFKCLESGIDDQRTAIFLTVMHQVLEAANDRGWTSAKESFDDFKTKFVRFCDADEDLEYEPFTVQQARKLTHHVSSTFFRFYSSFKFAFTEARDTEEVEEDIFAEEPLAPRPLSEATQEN